MPFELSQVRKYFEVGDHVRVVAGRHEGETGIVVKIESNLAILFADLTMHEVSSSRVNISIMYIHVYQVSTAHIHVLYN